VVCHYPSAATIPPQGPFPRGPLQVLPPDLFIFLE
jgi:hypothetical protein